MSVACLSCLLPVSRNNKFVCHSSNIPWHQLPAEEHVDEGIKIVMKHDKVYKKVDYWKKKAVIAKHDFFGQPNDNPKLFVLRGAGGGVHHAISVVRKIVFVSNLSQCLTLSKASLHGCCTCEAGFSKVHAVIQVLT